MGPDVRLLARLQNGFGLTVDSVVSVVHRSIAAAATPAYRVAAASTPGNNYHVEQSER